VLLVRYYSLAPWFVGGSRSKAQIQVEACEEREDFRGHEARAVLALAEHRYADAIDALEQARALRPEERGPAYYLAKAYIGAEETSAATDVLESLVSRYPKFQDAWLELVLLAAQSEITSPRGMAALEHFLVSAPNASKSKRVEAALALSRLYEVASRPRAPVSTLRSLSDEFPDERRLHKTLVALCKRHQSTVPDCAAL
jgi:tetratricopeptide (TPR) repeat protein